MLPPEVSGDQPHLTTCYHLKSVPNRIRAFQSVAIFLEADFGGPEACVF